MTLDMSRRLEPAEQPGGRAAILHAAAAQGLWLTRRPLDNGEYAWTWLADGDSRPQPLFLTRRQAIDFMAEKLGAS
jgi:hypothetical protein